MPGVRYGWVCITIGEMILLAFSQAPVASFCPEDTRGRYMAIYGFSRGIPFAVGPYLAGLLIDGPKPYLLWYVAGFVGILSTVGFLGLHRTRSQLAKNSKSVAEAAIP